MKIYGSGKNLTLSNHLQHHKTDLFYKINFKNHEAGIIQIYILYYITRTFFMYNKLK